MVFRLGAAMPPVLRPPPRHIFVPDRLGCVDIIHAAVLRHRMALENGSIIVSRKYTRVKALDLGVIHLALELLVLRDLPHGLHKVLLRCSPPAIPCHATPDLGRRCVKKINTRTKRRHSSCAVRIRRGRTGYDG